MTSMTGEMPVNYGARDHLCMSGHGNQWTILLGMGAVSSDSEQFKRMPGPHLPLNRSEVRNAQQLCFSFPTGGHTDREHRRMSKGKLLNPNLIPHLLVTTVWIP